MMENNCYVVMDLMPLYVEGLLSEKTTELVHAHLDSCDTCKNLYESSSIDIDVQKPPKENTMDKEIMFKKISRKLSTYQIIFVILSFFLAINTSLINESFGFLLWYPVLGVLTYLFYKDFKIVFMLSFIPIFLWDFGRIIISRFSSGYGGINFISFFLENLFSSSIFSLFHLIFALIGAVIGLLILKLK